MQRGQDTGKSNKWNYDRFDNYFYEVDGINVGTLKEKGFTTEQAESFLNKIRLRKIIEKDNGGKNEIFNISLDDVGTSCNVGLHGSSRPERR